MLAGSEREGKTGVRVRTLNVGTMTNCLELLGSLRSLGVMKDDMQRVMEAEDLLWRAIMGSAILNLQVRYLM